MAQQTAVEFLLSELDIVKLIEREKLTMAAEVVRQAKAMEKHQIMSAYDLGNQNQYNKICISNYVNIDEEQYYNEAYNK